MARAMNVSRSRLVSLALEDFIRSHQNRLLLEQIDAAYADLPEPEDELLVRRMHGQHRHIVEGEW